MNFWHSLGGIVLVDLTSADISGLLHALEVQNIPIYDALFIDQMRMQFSLRRKDLSRLQSFVEKRGAYIHILEERGLHTYWEQYKKRPALILGILVIALISMWLPSRVFFVQIEGNQNLPAALIKEYAENCGIGFGASRKAVRSEKMKNKLLEAMPQLQWAGVNTYGCTAVITVRERQDLSQQPTDTRIGSIVALRDAIVRKITVYRGNALCHIGQAVSAGEVLVSGYTDCGICILGTQAKAEIFGETKRTISVIQPSEYMLRSGSTNKNKKFSIIIGKKRINFSKGSGISGYTCAKIYEEKYMTLPGGFTLPIAIACETEISYDTSTQKIVPNGNMLRDFARNYISKQMIGGSVIYSTEEITETAQFCRMDARYGCYELIGIIRTEERIKTYE